MSTDSHLPTTIPNSPPEVRIEVSRTSSLDVRPFVFRKADWSYIGDEEKKTVRGVPGTWDVGPVSSPTWLLAMVCCPACGTISLLHNRVHQASPLGLITPDLRCSFKKNGGQQCGFLRKAYLDEWNKKPLYACAVERNGKPEIHYMHAKNQAEARIHLGPGAYKIVAIGRAIGFFVHDSHGDSLSAEGRFAH